MTAAPALNDTDEKLRETLDRLCMMSERDYYDPYKVFKWPKSLPEQTFWMSPELMSVHGTDVADELGIEQLHRLSKWESINFYSLNVHGIRELLNEIIGRIHTRGFEMASEYMHHIVGEENEHMWFFATFCLKYGGKIYADKQLRWNNADQAEAANFLVFARLWIFEEIVDYFNAKMGVDQRLHETIKQVNAIHHHDESRHIAFGRQIVGHLYTKLASALPAEQLLELERHLKDYMRASVDSLASPAAYRDAGIPDPYAARRRVLESPRWQQFTTSVLRRPTDYLVKSGIFTEGAAA
ncbi:diiron oxygenase [Nocardia sp. NPDC006044]|uniref:diiron oxygenase n=1 Tax=Nocardia sp. NPDC006044 TaxID=3364306 RepID=UPI0036C20DF2